MGIIKQTIVKCDSCGVEAKCGSLNSFDAIAAMKRRKWVIIFGKKEKIDIRCNGCAAAPLPQKEKTYPFRNLEAGIQYVNSLILIGEYTFTEEDGSHGLFWLNPNPRGERTIDSVYSGSKEGAIKSYVIAVARKMGYSWAFE